MAQSITKTAIVLDGSTPTIVTRHFTRADEGMEWQVASEDVGLALHSLGLQSSPTDISYPRNIARMLPNGADHFPRAWYSNLIVGSFFGTAQLQAKPKFRNDGKDAAAGAFELLIAGDNMFPNADAPPVDLSTTTSEDAMDWMWRTSLPFPKGWETPGAKSEKIAANWKKPESTGRVSQKRIPKGIYCPGDLFIAVKLDEDGGNHLVLVCVTADGSLVPSKPLTPALLGGKDALTLNLKKHGIESTILLRFGENDPTVRQGGIPRYFMELQYVDYSPKEGKGFLPRPLSQGEINETELQKQDPARANEPRRKVALDGNQQPQKDNFGKTKFIYRPYSRPELVRQFAVTYFEKLDEVFCCRTSLRNGSVVGLRSFAALEEGDFEFEIADVDSGAEEAAASDTSATKAPEPTTKKPRGKKKEEVVPAN